MEFVSKCIFFSKVEVHSTRLKPSRPSKKMTHVNVTFSQILCYYCFKKKLGTNKQISMVTLPHLHL